MKALTFAVIVDNYNLMIAYIPQFLYTTNEYKISPPSCSRNNSRNDVSSGAIDTTTILSIQQVRIRQPDAMC
jgi:hypothetical protein